MATSSAKALPSPLEIPVINQTFEVACGSILCLLGILVCLILKTFINPTSFALSIPGGESETRRWANIDEAPYPFSFPSFKRDLRICTGFTHHGDREASVFAKNK